MQSSFYHHHKGIAAHPSDVDNCPDTDTMSISSLLRSEINVFNQDISRIRHVLLETGELFEEIEATTQLSGGGYLEVDD